MVSRPSFDPNPLANPDAEVQEEAWTALETDQAEALPIDRDGDE